MRLKDFDREWLQIRAVTDFVRQPVLGVELRRREDGVEFCINHVDCTIYMRFPGREDWFDYKAIEKWSSLGVMQSELITTLSNGKLLELTKMLKIRKGSAR